MLYSVRNFIFNWISKYAVPVYPSGVINIFTISRLIIFGNLLWKKITSLIEQKSSS